MIFPFSVRFNRSLKTTIKPDNKEQILQYIEESILKNKADNVIIKNMSVSYKGSTSYCRGSLFGSVDNGVFDLVYKENSWILNYQINMHQLFIVTSIMSIGMGAFIMVGGGPWWVGNSIFMALRCQLDYKPHKACNGGYRYSYGD